MHLIHAGQHRRALEELDLYVPQPPKRTAAVAPSLIEPSVWHPHRYLPSYPYQDNPVLHVYAGLMALYLAQPASASDMSEEATYGACITAAACAMKKKLLDGSCSCTFESVRTGQGWDASQLRNAQAHFERARVVDPSNVVADAFLNQVTLHTMHVAMKRLSAQLTPAILPAIRHRARSSHEQPLRARLGRRRGRENGGRRGAAGPQAHQGVNLARGRSNKRPLRDVTGRRIHATTLHARVATRSPNQTQDRSSA